MWIHANEMLHMGTPVTFQSFLFRSWSRIDRLKGKEEDLVCLSTNNLATPVEDLFWVEAFEEKTYKTFCNVRLESDPPKLKFYHKIAYLQAKHLASAQRRWKNKEGQTRKYSLNQIARSLLEWSLLLRTKRRRWMMGWATLSALSLGPLPRLMDRSGEPTNHHLP